MQKFNSQMTVKDYLNNKYPNQLSLRDFELISRNYQVDMSQVNFDQVFLDEITKFHLESVKIKPQNPFEENYEQRNKEDDDEEDSVFAPQKEPRTSKDVIDQLKAHMGDNQQFKIICNKIFTFVNGYKSDPSKSFNKVLAIMNEDFSDNQKAKNLLIELFTFQTLIVEIKAKGILIKVPDAIFMGHMEALGSIASKYKDQSLGFAKKGEVVSKGPQHDLNRSDRVSAYLENQKMRQLQKQQQQQQQYYNQTNYPMQQQFPGQR